MLFHDQQLRLTARERRILRDLTGSDPYYVTTRDELKDWVEQNLQSYSDDDDNIRRLKAILRRHLPV